MTAVVTGIGVVAPTGLGVDDYWKATLRGENGIGPITRFDSDQYPVTLAGEVHGFDAKQHIPSRLIPQTDHMTRLAIAAADWALADAGVDPARRPEYSMGVVTANAVGGFEFGQRELQKLWSKGPECVSAYQSFAWFYAVNTGQISIRHGMRGPSGVLVNEQAGGLDAITQARRVLRGGTALVVSGGIEGALCPWGWVAQLARGECSTCADPERAYRPFAADAEGYIPGEGGAILIVEDGETAAARGNPGYGEIVGASATFDPKPGSPRPPALRRAIELAIADADLRPSDVDVVFADAAGLPNADRQEADAISAVFGPRGVPVTAPKTMTGRLCSGAGPLDLATALLAIRDGVIPPTINVGETAPGYDIDLVDAARPATLRTAMVIARGNTGSNTVVIVRGPHRPHRPQRNN